MTDHGAKAEEHLQEAIGDEASSAWIHVAAAGVHAVLHISETIRHGLRDIVYELRD